MMRLSTPDPRFDPRAPLSVNGYRYEPGDPRGAEALQIEDVPIPAEFDSGSFAFGLIVGFVISALLWGGGLWAGGFYG